jgi:hypothetical protein
LVSTALSSALRNFFRQGFVRFAAVAGAVERRDGYDLARPNRELLKRRPIVIDCRIDMAIIAPEGSSESAFVGADRRRMRDDCELRRGWRFGFGRLEDKRDSAGHKNPVHGSPAASFMAQP